MDRPQRTNVKLQPSGPITYFIFQGYIGHLLTVHDMCMRSTPPNQIPITHMGQPLYSDLEADAH